MSLVGYSNLSQQSFNVVRRFLVVMCNTTEYGNSVFP